MTKLGVHSVGTGILNADILIITKTINTEKFPSYLFVIIGLLVFALMRIIGFDGLYGQDAYEYARYTVELRSALLSGTSIGSFYWPVFYPLVALLPDLVINDIGWSMQLVSIVAYVLTLQVSFSLAKELYPTVSTKVIFWYVFIFIGLSPYFLRFGVSGMSDMLCLLFVMLCFRYYLGKEFRYKLVMVLLFGFLAFQTRYGAAVIVFIPIMHSLINAFRERQYKWILVAASTALASFIPYILLKGINYNEVISTSIVVDWSVMHWFQRSFESKEGGFTYFMPNIIYGFYSFFNPAFLFIGSLLIVNTLASKIKLTRKIFIPIVIYALFIAGLHFQNKRFLLMILPLVAIGLLPSYVALVNKIKNHYFKLLFLALSLLLNIGLAIYSFKHVYVIQLEEKQVYSMMNRHNTNTVFTFEMDVSLQGRGNKSTFINLWKEEKIDPKKGDFILLNETKWKDQWSHHLLMQNCKQLTSSFSLKLVDTAALNWKLYIVE